MPTGRAYTAEFDLIAIAATTTDLIELKAATDKPAALVGWEIGQSTELGDAQEEGLRFRWVRGNTTSGSGGTAVTPRPTNLSDTAAGITCEVGNTTAATAGTAINMHTMAWNIRLPWEKWLPTGFEYWFSGSTLLVCRLTAAPADSVSFSGTVFLLETG
jgi:hypothetical protein